MKRKPGPLTKNDRAEIAAFQKAHDCKVDGKLGRQTKDALWARLARASTHAFNWPSALVGLLVGSLLALIVS